MSETVDGGRIVLIEDNPENARLATRLLKERFEVFVAQDGESGIAAVQTHQPDLVLVDLGLPDVDGQTVIAMLRQNPTWAKLPIVAFTAYPEESAYEIARVYGCNGVIFKPIDTRVFLTQVSAFLA
jgi:CheY-like chemotaxis protein